MFRMWDGTDHSLMLTTVLLSFIWAMPWIEKVLQKNIT